MNKLKTIVAFGTRPEAIKLAPLIIKLKEDSRFDVYVVNSGQHKTMCDDVLSFFDIVPCFNFNVMARNQTLSSLTVKLSKNFENLFKKINPDLVIIQGDTTTSFIGALISFYNKIKIAHVEAGLRTNNFYNPFPEEMNRKFISEIANYHFPPTIESKKNLLKEGIDKSQILCTGNTIVDSLIIANKKLKNTNVDDFLNQINFNSNRKNIFISCHRRESFGDGIKNICKAINILSKSNNEYRFYFPVHLNPNVRRVVNKTLKNLDNVNLLEPLDYPSLLSLIKSVDLILTDSGGIQEEAPSFNKFVFVLRESTERPEGLKAGFSKLVGTDTNKIIKEVNLFFNQNILNIRNIKFKNPYGDGNASKRILDFLWKNNEHNLS